MVIQYMYSFLFWYVAPRKIWQPSTAGAFAKLNTRFFPASNERTGHEKVFHGSRAVCDCGLLLSRKEQLTSQSHFARGNGATHWTFPVQIPPRQHNLFYLSPNFPGSRTPWGAYRYVEDVAFCFMPGVEHQSILVPVALAPNLKISILPANALFMGIHKSTCVQ
jgi:hypothetical protein